MDVADDTEDGFVSISLDDDLEECDICHQRTEENLISVILSDEFTRFDGTYNERAGNITKAHEICLNRWAAIIHRNISRKSPAFSKEGTPSSEQSRSPVVSQSNSLRGSPVPPAGSPSLIRTNLSEKKKTRGVGTESLFPSCESVDGQLLTKACTDPEDEIFIDDSQKGVPSADINENSTCNGQLPQEAQDNRLCQCAAIVRRFSDSDDDNLAQVKCFCSAAMNQSKNQPRLQLARPKPRSREELASLDLDELRRYLEKMNSAVKETSEVLVSELQMRDRLKQEISGQNSTISQLVRLQKTNNPLPKGSPIRLSREPIIT